MFSQNEEDASTHFKKTSKNNEKVTFSGSDLQNIYRVVTKCQLRAYLYLNPP